MAEEKVAEKRRSASFGCLQMLGIMAVFALAAVLLSAWWVKHNVYADTFRPTKLSEKEQKVLEEKLDMLEKFSRRERKPERPAPRDAVRDGRLVPEPYTEEGAAREIRITEKELNAIIARDEETAKRVAIDLSDDMVSIKMLIPVDRDFPVLGGKTIRLNCGITLSYAEGKPVVAIRGISVGGIPLPNAWLGNIKNTNLVQEFGGQGGFWDIFSEGVEDIKVQDGSFYVRLRE